ncbi:ABC transporter substrate-binding protein [Virgisporangium aurantiacum]|uniref:Peptide ABC transporter substrate-binding protein n=1 Tax=Virgisporangium aurantiacum TaxID=175570 RepID=A0A8J4DZ93_9ACTN|nr:ABC transporter substrate-binding protein [Virgisporangium aurantiacum]GIJ55288.1 peptide ABC transporter substrate-binding protein [Virgisporangium aurantiacum]
MSDHPTRRQVIKGAAAVGAAVAGASALAACGDDSGDTLTERQQTLFIAGFQWGPPPNWNPLSPTAAWTTAGDQMQLVYETLFGFDLLDSSLKPQLATKLTENPDSFVVALQPDAKWHDGKPVTADDVVYTFELAKRIKTVHWSSAWEYLDSVTKTDDKTVTFKLSATRPNPGMTKTNLCKTYVLPSHLWKDYESKNPNIIEFLNDKPVGSGPYKLDSYNAQQLVFVRYDDYWGKGVRGKLPAPKKIVHPIFKDNAAGNLAFERGEVDIMQQFTPEIWKMWQEKKLPVGTWFPETPFHLPGSMPMLTLNTTKPGLNNPKVRRALAHMIDYSRIAETAMSRYSVPANASLILPSDSEKKFWDESEIKGSNGWKYDPAKAAEILEKELGAKKGSDGIYTLGDGTKLGPWTVQTPNGWTDWQAAVNIVVENFKAAGVDVKVNFPEANTVTPAVQNGNYDLALFYIGASTDSSTPWARFRDVLDIRGTNAIGQSSFYNYGRFNDSRVAPLLDTAAKATGDAQVAPLKELDKIYREGPPMIALMYRPLDFYEFNQTVWTGFPTAKNPKAPPTFRGAGIAWLYEISPK